jgi:cell wall assembly regulator SMI1
LGIVGVRSAAPELVAHRNALVRHRERARIIGPVQSFMTNFIVSPPASAETLRAAERDIGKILPEDYKTFLLEHNGGDGFIGADYVILWKAEELSKFNDGYEVSKYAPGLLVFGSNGDGDGFAFDTRTSPNLVMQVPFIGMSAADEFRVAGSFNELLERMHEKMVHSSEQPPRSEPKSRGKEIFEVKPVILGGNPTDTENKVALTRDQHMEVVRYWNKVISDLQAQQVR